MAKINGVKDFQVDELRAETFETTENVKQAGQGSNSNNNSGLGMDIEEDE